MEEKPNPNPSTKEKKLSEEHAKNKAKNLQKY